MATTKLYVGNLPWNTTKESLANLFQQYGDVEDAFIPLDRDSGRSRGFGFVTMETTAAKNAAAALNNTEFDGRTIRVNEAAPPGERGGGGGGGRGGYGGGGGGYGGGGGRGGGGGGYGGDSYGGGYGGNRGGGGGGGYGGGYNNGGYNSNY